MKTIKTKLAGFILLVLASASLFLTCDVGLGNSVSTKPPTVSITSPAANSDVAGTLAMTGAAAADTSLASVAVTFIETSSGSKYGPFAATVDATAKAWSIDLNKTAGSREIPDGTYKVSVVATDSAKRTSEANTVYQIDNTPPTVMVTSPLTYGSSNRISYFNTVDIKGEVYDSSSIDSVVVYMIAPGATAPCDSKTADGTNTWTVRFDYSSTQPAGISDGSVCSYKLVAKDHAGNTNTYFFHRSDIYPLLTAAADGSVTFPAMSQIGKLDQLGSATDLGGLTKAGLDSVKHGTPQTAAQQYPDFTFRNGSSPDVDWLNISTTSNTVGIGVPLVGDIRPPADGSSIDQSSVCFYVYPVYSKNDSNYDSSFPYYINDVAKGITKKAFADLTTAQQNAYKHANFSTDLVSSSLNFTVQTKDSGGTPLPEASYAIELSFTTNTKKDYKSWTVFKSGVPMTMRFSISSGAPTLTETALGGAGSPFAATVTTKDPSSITLSGISKDSAGNALSPVSYTVTKGGTKIVPAGSVTADSTSRVYTISDLNGLVTTYGDGTYSYDVSIESGGVPATVSRTIIVDRQAPVISATSVSSSTAAKKVNGKITVSGTITDNVAVASAEYSVNGGAAVSVLSGLPSWTTTDIDTTLYPDGKTLADILGFNVLDTAGNAGVLSSTSPAIDLSSYVIDQSSDKPVISFSNLTSGAAHLSNNLGSTLMLNGSASDDDGVNKDKVLIGIAADADKDGAPDTAFAYIAVTGKPSANGTLVSFSENLGSTGLNLAEGYYVMQVRAGDINSPAAYDGGYNWAQSNLEKFVVDKAPPIVTIDQAQNSYHTNAFTLSGTVVDSGTGVKSSDAVTHPYGTILVDGATVAVASGGTWTTTINVASDGDYSIPIVATDNAEQVTNTTFKFTKDSVKPNVAITSSLIPLLAAWQKNTNVIINGTVDDSSGSVHSGVKSVEYSTDSTNGTDGTWTALTLTDSSTKWNGVVSFPEAAGNKLWIRATDNAGNVQTNLPLTIKVDATAPTLTETAVAAQATPRSYNGNIVFQGTASDGLSGMPATMSLGYTKNGVAQTAQTVNVSDFTGSGYVFAVNAATHADDGVYEFTLTATDAAGNSSSVNYTVTVETMPPAVAFNMTPSDSTSGKYNGTVPVKASITDDNTIKSLYWQVSSSATVPAYNAANVKTNAAAASVGTGWQQVGSSLNSLNDSWDSSGAGTAADETRYVWIVTSDRFGNISSASNALTVSQDTDIPVVTFTNYAIGSYVGELTLKGTVSDDDGVVNAIAAKVDGSAVSPTVSGNSFSIPMGSQGTKSLLMSVTDKAGKTFTFDATTKLKVMQGGSAVSKTSAIGVIVDADDPALIINTAQNQWMGSNFTISGTAEDGTGSNLFGLAGSAVTVSGAGFATQTPAVTGGAWSATIPTSSISEGTGNTLTVSATDTNGRSRAVTFKYNFDKTPPSVSLTTDVSGWFKAKSVSLSGTVSDVGPSGVKSVEYSTDSTNGTDGSWTGLTVSGAAWSGTITFTESATNKLYLRATDNAGNVQTNLPMTVKVDATAPTLTETAVAAQATPRSYNGNIVFQGTASDGLSGMPATMSLGYTKNGVAQTAQTVNVSDFTGSGYVFAVNAATHADDGVYEFTLTATDAAGNSSSVNYTVTVETMPPAVAFNMTPSDSTSGKYNGTVPVKASITDDNTIKSLYWQVSSSATVPAYNAANVKTNAAAASVGTGWQQVGSSLNSLNDSWDSSGAGTAADETRYVWIVTSDRFGNISSASNALTVSQDTDIPVVTFTNYAIGSYVGELTLKGTVSDDDGVVNAIAAKVDGSAVSPTVSGNSFSIPMGSQGTKSLLMSVTDKAGKTFTFDATTKLKVMQGGSAVSKTSAIGVIVDADDPALIINTAQNQWMGSNFTISGTAEDGTGSNLFGLAGSAVTVSGAGFATQTPAVTGGAWSATIPTSSISEGTGNTLTVSATDTNGRSRAVTFKYNFDKTPPSVSLTTINGGASATFFDWKKTASLSVVGTAGDGTGSGIALVEYSLDGTNWSQLSGTTAWNGSIPVSDGAYTLQFRVKDNAGNYSSIASHPVRIDLTNPTLTVSTPSSLIRVNGGASLSTAFISSDTGGSLIASVKLKIGSAVFTTPDAAASLSSGTNESGTWTASIPAATLAALTNGQQYSVYVQSSDNAGNTATTSFPIVIDTQKPTVTVTTPLSASTVNKIISVTGSGGDDQALSTVVLSIEKSDLSTWVPIATFNGTAGFNWSVSSFDTTLYSSDASYDTDGATSGIQLTLRAIATDEAGNVSSTATRTFTVDQDSDRPIIKLSNVDVDGSTTLKMTNAVYGSVTDDDGVTLFEVSENGSSWTTVATDGSWSYSASSGDGTKTLYFRVTDAAGTIFTTGGATTPKIQFGATIVSTPITFKVDTLPPELSSVNPAVIDRTSAYDFADATAIAANMPLGGGVSGPYHQFKLRVLAKDANGIASVSVSLPGATGTPFTAAANGADASEPTFTRFDTSLIDVSSMTDGVATITVTVTDNSGLASSVNRSVLIDNTAPTVTHSSPRSLIDVVNGEVTVKGLSNDGLGSGLASVKYQVGLCADRSSGSASWTDVSGSLFSWEIPFTGSNKIDQYGGLSLTLDTASDKFSLTSHGYTNGTAVYFDGATLATNMSSTTTYYVVNATANDFQVSTSVGGPAVDFSGSPASLCVSKYSKDTNNDGIWELPILIRAADAAGNVRIDDYTDYIALVDPSGDKPKVSIVYPDPSNLNRTMGGTIRIFGTATDDDAVGSVYMQIDVNGDGSYTAADVDSTSKDWYNSGLGQVVSGTASWNQAINASNEFNPIVDGTTRTIHFRVRAKDIYGTYGAWSSDQTIVVDNKIPRIGSSNALSLTQGATSRTYVSDMWIKGNWTLGGSIEDESGISDIQITGDITGSLSANPSWFSSATFGLNSGYTLAIPVNTSGTGTRTFTITTTDNSTPQTTNSITLIINYDNTAPTDNGYTGSTPVVQSNRVYTLKGSVNEAGSGFDKLAFYFERTPTTDRVYNPMESKTGNANCTNMSGLTMVDGLPCLTITGATRSTTYSLTSPSLVNNKNVRVGGLVNIGGIYRYILTVNYATGTITWADAVDSSVSTAYAAYAMVVNNTTIETPVWTGDTLTSITNDDNDGMVEAVERSGGLYSWTASIDSKNIPDGPIDIHYVAYDKAGNFKTGVVSTTVANSGPRIAKVIVGTDLDGNGLYDTSEVSTVYAYTGASGSESAVPTIIDPNFTMKDKLAVLADIVGGNGTLNYVWAAGSAALSSPTTSVSPSAFTSITVSGGSTYPYGMELRPDDVSSYEDTKKTLSFSVWDSTEETVSGTTSQWAIINVPITIDVVDNVKPTASINPFYWISAIDNSLYGNSKANGHIEYTAVPSVSGQVSIRGAAFDDKRLTALWMNIDDNAATPSTRFAFTNSLASKLVSTGTTPATRTYYRVATYGIPGSATAAGDLLGFTDSALIGNVDIAVGVSITVNGYNRTVATWNSASGKITWTGTVAKNASAPDYTYVVNTSKWYVTDAWAASKGWKFSITSNSITQAGHTASWQLDWDSSYVSGVANAGNYIRIIAEDGKGSPVATLSSPAATQPNASTESSVNTTDTTKTACYQMNVVPYIKRLETMIYKNAGSEFSRSALGKYSVYAGEPVDLYGFNLNGASTTVKIGSTTLAAPTANSGYITFNVGTTAVSGDVTVQVNSVSSINNSNSNPTFDGSGNVTANAYNSMANGVNNDRLDDDVSVYIWNMGTFLSQTNLTSPVMKMDAASNYYMSYGYGVPSMYVNKNGTTTQVDYSYNKFQNTNVAFDGDGNLYAVGTNTDRISDSSAKFAFYSGAVAVGSGNSGLYQSSWTGKNLMETVYNDATGVYDINRVRTPKIAAYGSGISRGIVMSYYDGNHSKKPVKFRYGHWVTYTGNGTSRTYTQVSGTKTATVGSAVTVGNYLLINGSYVLVTAVSGSPTRTVTLALTNNFTSSATFSSEQYTASVAGSVQGGFGTNIASTSEGYSAPDTASGSADGYHVIASTDTTYKGGQYSAVGAVPKAGSGYVGVVAWYDASSRSLMYSYNENPETPVIGGAWQTNARVIDSGYSGWYVDMTVDAGGGIHIAYYNSAKGDLKYAYLSSYTDTNPKVVTVDSYLSVGTQISINTRLEGSNYVPYITYYHASFTQTPNAVRIAWRKDFTSLSDGASGDKATGAWEMMTIPTQNIPVDGLICNGVPTSGTYANTQVVGFFSDAGYERAVLKK